MIYVGALIGLLVGFCLGWVCKQMKDAADEPQATPKGPGGPGEEQPPTP